MNGQPKPSDKGACRLAADVVRKFGAVRLRVFGTSMVPSILPGSLIAVQRADISEISTGDIVLYSRDGRLFAHRVVDRTGVPEQPRLVTRGDRLSYDDPPISSNELLGRVTSIQRGDGRGHREIQSYAQVNVWKRLILRILRRSDRATFLYLRFVSMWPDLFSGRASCRA